MTDKGRILAFPDAAAIEADAAAWVARFDAGDVSAKDQAAFQEWLNRSALHRDAVASLARICAIGAFAECSWSTSSTKRGTTASAGSSAMLMLFTS